MRKKHKIIVALAVVFIAIGLVGAYTLNNNEVGKLEETGQSGPEGTVKLSEKTKQAQSFPTSDARLAKGRYTAYSEEKRSEDFYNRTIIFFHAPWCPQCRAFEKNLTEATIPDGTQILVADYDSSTELKKQYGVTIQTTFVRVNPDGSPIHKWVGYTSNHSLAAVLMAFKL